MSDETSIVAASRATGVAAGSVRPAGRTLPAAGTVSPAAGNELPPAAAPAGPDLARLAERLRELAQQSGRSLEFRIDEASGRTVITVLNAATSEVVRQIPPEEVLAVARALDQLGAVLTARA